MTGAADRSFHGRRHGKRLRPAQRARLAQDLPGLTPAGVDPGTNPDRHPVDPAGWFGDARPIWLEIGFGGGEHMVRMAAENPHVGVVGCEPFVNGVAMALGKIAAARLTNIRIWPGDVRDLLDVLPASCLARVFALYPDPWPKARHHKRRLVTPGYLRPLARAMAPGAALCMATDIDDYARQALIEVPRAGLAWTARAPADWRQPWPGWQPTRYEAKALAAGRRPVYLTFVRGSGGCQAAAPAARRLSFCAPVPGRAGLRRGYLDQDEGSGMATGGKAVPMTAHRGAPLAGVAAVPGDKSVSHRALILGALSVGETRISGLLEGQDVRDTARAMASFGAEILRHDAGVWSVHGVGVGGFAEPGDVIDCGNSGTGVRLIMGAMATTPIAATFTGDASLRARPMGRITAPLAQFGARAFGRAGGRLPMTVLGAREPLPVRYTLPVASAQVKSAVLLAGLNAPGCTVVIEPEPTRDHTERMLAGFGADIAVEQRPEGRVIALAGRPELRAQEIAVPRDPSSAAFPVCAALIVEGAEIRVPGIGLNPTRAGLYDTLIDMGADLTFENRRIEGGEPVADLVARFSAGMRGIEVPPERAASMIDEYPVLAAVAACAEGTTVMRGIAELRVKECDRIAAMAAGLAACGVAVEETEDSLTVHGRGPGGVAGGATVASHLDHRIAMSFLVLGLAARAPVTVDDARPIATSFPGFADLMRGLGADLRDGAG
ncbi:MAG: 3-phosphoshikimate 1-carboxyvinyltransferase [Rhodobacteraceae bacterium]|jgi:3-phosphoshikimate 1-carboxyvinyltransferase|nr:3-phosphoshikimate 1-carboxyvinyltransferase [Paracoccaceae bacterium]